jgi:hypothetical protein
MIRVRLSTVRWTNWIGLVMTAITLTVFLTIAPTPAYSFQEDAACTCYKDGKASSNGACSGGQRCGCDTNGDPYWWDDEDCPCDEM